MLHPDYIEDFLKHKLSPEEIKQFSSKIESDPAFAEETAFYFTTVQEIKRQSTAETKKRFREMYQQLREPDEKRKARLLLMNKWWRGAAAVAVLAFILSAWFWLFRSNTSSLAEKYIKDNFTELPVTMGKTDSLQEAAALFNEGKLKAALSFFKHMAGAGNSETTAIKNAGIVSLRLKDYDQALVFFIRLENINMYANPGMFYHAVVLIERNQQGDKQTANQLLQQVIDRKLGEYEIAAQWLNK